MGFLSLTYDDGVFSLKLDFLFFRPRKKKAVAPVKGPRPLPPPFPLPPLHVPPPPVELLIDAPALRSASVVRGYTQVEAPVCEPTRASPPSSAATLIDDDEVAVRTPEKTNYARQRRDVRNALRDLKLTDL